MTYKALCAAGQLAHFYPDLEDAELAVSFAIFHQRFSTNTEPSWERAQRSAPLPQRRDQHDRRQRRMDGGAASVTGGRAGLAPALDHAGSDSALLDNALDLVVRGQDKDLAEAVSLLVRLRGRTTRGSIRTCATSTATARC